MTLALEARARADDIFVGDTPKAQRRKHRLKGLNARGRLWKHSRLSDVDDLAEMPDPVFIFTLVRNPWDRMISLYRWAQKQGFLHPMVQAAQDLSFEGFLADAAMQSLLRRDRAIDYVTDREGQVCCDAFVRLENLATDLAPVEDHLGFRLAMPKPKRSGQARMSQSYTAETKAIVAELFADDIQRFGYSFPG